MMTTVNTESFSLTLQLAQSPGQVFETLLNVRSWWSGLFNETFEGVTDELNGEFTFHAGDGVHYSRHRLIELEANKRLVWLITDGALSFVEQKDEWKETRMCFDLKAVEGGTELTFTHEGLTPALECYDSCSSAWTQYLKERLKAALENN